MNDTKESEATSQESPESRQIGNEGKNEYEEHESSVKLLGWPDVQQLRGKPRYIATEKILLALDGFPMNEAEEIVKSAIDLVKAYSPIRLTRSTRP
jgi:hypothetical protein